MAKGNAVWGIDIGQCALKALRCTYDPREDQVVADACDFIEYPKILSQPDADPEVLVRDAIKEFLSRNSVRGDRVAISVAGQQGLARFIKLPPVEAKKIPKIVEYEAKQQIPFALEDVIWDYQMLMGGGTLDGMAIENEVGLFAMKRDQVLRAIRPLDDVGIEIDHIQLTPVSIFNTTVHNVIGKLPPIEDYNPDDPPPSVVVLSMGTDTTDLVVTNGFRVWQRSIPLGGNHFTKQLTKELKLTFAAAEHLKRNSREAEDPKKVFQAMRPVFNDLVTEVQRSIGFFESLDRTAKIESIVGVGNAFKLPGLEPYLEKNLGHKVTVMDSYQHLVGPVLQDDKFKKNAQSMAVCYGLVLQGLGQAKLRTNLVPRELVRARMIRRKKPWVLAAASVLMAGLAVSFLFYFYRAVQVDEKNYESQFSRVSQVSSQSSGFVSTDDANKTKFADLKAVGDQVVGNSDRRLQMLELAKAVNSALPREPGLKPGEVSKLPWVERPELHIESVEMQFFGGEEGDLTTWFNEDAQAAYALTLKSIAAMENGAPQPNTPAVAEGELPATEGGPDNAAADVAPATDVVAAEDSAVDEEAAAEIPEGDVVEGNGWVVELIGYHHHNKQYPMAGPEYVRRTLLRNLMKGTVSLPVGNGRTETFTMEELGISHPILASPGSIKLEYIPNPKYSPPEFAFGDEYGQAKTATDGIVGITTAKPKTPASDEPKEPKEFSVKTNRFKAQFIWKPTTIAERLEKREEKANGDGNSTADTDNKVAGRGF